MREELKQARREFLPYTSHEVDILEQTFNVLFEHGLIVPEKMEPAEMSRRLLATIRYFEGQLAERDERITLLAKAAQALLGNIAGKTTQGRFIVHSLDVMTLQMALSQMMGQEPPAQSGQSSEEEEEQHG